MTTHEPPQYRPGPDLRLHGSRALVTGSTGAIGEAIVRALASAGASVVVHGRSRGAAQMIADSISAGGATAVPTAADLTDDSEVERLSEELHAELGGVDILVNNAGGYSNTNWWTATPATWLDHYDANVVSAVRLIQSFASGMRANGFGRIIQIASGLATQPFPFIPEYSATKAAMVNLTVSLAQELAGSGVTVNTVSPGLIRTPGIEVFYRADATNRGWGEAWEQIEAGVVRDVLPNAVGRLGRVEEVADLVTFLSSSRAAYINGANLRIDGASTTSIN